MDLKFIRLVFESKGYRFTDIPIVVGRTPENKDILHPRLVGQAKERFPQIELIERNGNNSAAMTVIVSSKAARELVDFIQLVLPDWSSGEAANWLSTSWKLAVKQPIASNEAGASLALRTLITNDGALLILNIEQQAKSETVNLPEL